MCDVLDRVEARGKAEGIAEGEARGEVQGKKEMAINLHKQSVPVEVIAKAAGVAVDVVKKWLGLETA
jgi:predicted transposase YdaD